MSIKVKDVTLINSLNFIVKLNYNTYGHINNDRYNLV